MSNGRKHWRKFRGSYADASIAALALAHDTGLFLVVFIGCASATLIFYPQALVTVLGLRTLDAYFERIPFLYVYIGIGAMFTFVVSVAQCYAIMTADRRFLKYVLFLLSLIFAATLVLSDYWLRF